MGRLKEAGVGEIMVRLRVGVTTHPYAHGRMPARKPIQTIGGVNHAFRDPPGTGRDR